MDHCIDLNSGGINGKFVITKCRPKCHPSKYLVRTYSGQDSVWEAVTGSMEMSEMGTWPLRSLEIRKKIKMWALVTTTWTVRGKQGKNEGGKVPRMFWGGMVQWGLQKAGWRQRSGKAVASEWVFRDRCTRTHGDEPWTLLVRTGVGKDSSDRSSSWLWISLQGSGKYTSPMKAKKPCQIDIALKVKRVYLDDVLSNVATW